jgi:hypothetical protein
MNKPPTDGRTLGDMVPNDGIWAYICRPDNRIAVTLDNNMWNVLYEQQAHITLKDEFPGHRFALFIPREVEIEALAIDEARKPDLVCFIKRTRGDCGIRTAATFGFSTGGLERYGGFDQGTFQSDGERARLAELRQFLGSQRRGSGLVHNEADVSLANSAFTSVVVTTDDSPPLRFAAKRGGRVVFLDRAQLYQPTELRCHVEATYASGRS